MAPTIAALDATLGATITDIDLSNLDDETWATVEDAFHQYALLIFPGQNLSRSDHPLTPCETKTREPEAEQGQRARFGDRRSSNFKLYGVVR